MEEIHANRRPTSTPRRSFLRKNWRGSNMSSAALSWFFHGHPREISHAHGHSSYIQDLDYLRLDALRNLLAYKSAGTMPIPDSFPASMPRMLSIINVKQVKPRRSRQSGSSRPSAMSRSGIRTSQSSTPRSKDPPPSRPIRGGFFI